MLRVRIGKFNRQRVKHGYHNEPVGGSTSLTCTTLLVSVKKNSPPEKLLLR